MDLGQQIGANLKQLRTERGLTLGQLSSLAGISKAMLSELEKGNANPTINTLWKIANGLKVPTPASWRGRNPPPPWSGGRRSSPDRGGGALPGVLLLPRRVPAKL